MTKRSVEEGVTAFLPAGSDVLAKSRLARYVLTRDYAAIALAICSLALRRVLTSPQRGLSQLILTFSHLCYLF